MQYRGWEAKCGNRLNPTCYCVLKNENLVAELGKDYTGCPKKSGTLDFSYFEIKKYSMF